ncbi:hypothetical protein [Agarilytica rhodophyticola]|uniref:hypothetical protein n=1 Tax=Agarilytica rhodophyticola TaxID=1737490 RepID=UPI000B349052|nr:hypothetical protein [Agarilytica rhodophyticola]
MNNSSIIPETYEQWRHCIIVECGLELTPKYISERISALQDDRDYYTQQFVKLYGRQYLQQVLAWFMQAQKNV